MLYEKNIKKFANMNANVINIKTYFGSYKIEKNGILHIHTLLWFNDELLIPICKYKHYMMMKTFLKT
jgi:hypothetical protein